MRLLISFKDKDIDEQKKGCLIFCKKKDINESNIVGS